MMEGIVLAAIFAVAVVVVIRVRYRAFTGKNSGCAGCPGNCGQDCSCSHPQHEPKKENENDMPHYSNVKQDKEL